jgi:hypothetical protein
MDGRRGASEAAASFCSRSAEQSDMKQTSGELLTRCLAASRNGADFPAIWHSVLKGHTLVVGPPVNSVRAGHITLEVPLITGQRLVFDSNSSELALG